MTALAGPGASDLDDLSQLAAEQVLRSLSSFRGDSELGTWIYSICYRVLLRERSWYRRFRLRFELDASAGVDVESDDASPNAALEQRERLRGLYAALGRLSDKYRAVVVLHDIEELSVREIAGIIDAGELTVRSRLRDGRKQLRKLLEAALEQAPLGGEHELTPS